MNKTFIINYAIIYYLEMCFQTRSFSLAPNKYASLLKQNLFKIKQDLLLSMP